MNFLSDFLFSLNCCRNQNDVLARPDPVGVFSPHEIDAYYLGWAGNGHINRFNISHAFYWVWGRDELNPLAGRKLDINAQMAAVELSYDRDWMRFRSSFFWASGDGDINDGQGEGFDAIFDNPNFAGGEFSYWQRQAVRLFGVNLVQRQSLVPNLRSSKFEGQTNFVNPGLYLINAGVDADLTPRLKLIANGNLLWFEQTELLEQFVFQGEVRDGLLERGRLSPKVLHLRTGCLADSIASQTSPACFEELFRPGIVQALGNTLAAAQLGDAVIAAQPFEHDPDLLFG